MSSVETGRRSSGRLAQAHEQASAPVPISGSRKSMPRRISNVSKQRRRSVSMLKDQAPVPGQDYSVSMPAPRLSGNMLDEDMDEDEVNDGPDGEVKSKVKGKRTKKGVEVFQCEKCSKWYRHPACLIKHRWQHTEYWAQTSSMMMSKHQSVMMLEAAAILTNGSSLPESREYWPAAVSPPSSGLLGSELHNRTGRSPLVGSLTQRLMAAEEEDEDDKEEEEEDVSMELESIAAEDEGMFAFEMGSGKEGDSSSGGEDKDSGYASTGETAAAARMMSATTLSPSYRTSFQPAFPQIAKFPYGGVGSAPSLGFFEPRRLSPQ